MYLLFLILTILISTELHGFSSITIEFLMFSTTIYMVIERICAPYGFRGMVNERRATTGHRSLIEALEDDFDYENSNEFNEDLVQKELIEIKPKLIRFIPNGEPKDFCSPQKKDPSSKRKEIGTRLLFIGNRIKRYIDEILKLPTKRQEVVSCTQHIKELSGKCMDETFRKGLIKSTEQLLEHISCYVKTILKQDIQFDLIFEKSSQKIKILMDKTDFAATEQLLNKLDKAIVICEKTGQALKGKIELLRELEHDIEQQLRDKKQSKKSIKGATNCSKKTQIDDTQFSELDNYLEIISKYETTEEYQKLIIPHFENSGKHQDTESLELFQNKNGKAKSRI